MAVNIENDSMTNHLYENPPLVEVIGELRWELQQIPSLPPEARIDPHFESFKQDLRDNKLEYSNNMDQLDYHASRDAGSLTMYVDMKRPKINDEILNLPLSKTYDSPFLQADYGSSQVTIIGTDGKKMTLDFDY